LAQSPESTGPAKLGTKSPEGMPMAKGPFFGKPQSTAIKSERISNLYPLPGAFHGYTDEKEEDLSYYSDGIHSVEHHAF